MFSEFDELLVPTVIVDTISVSSCVVSSFNGERKREALFDFAAWCSLLMFNVENFRLCKSLFPSTFFNGNLFIGGSDKEIFNNPWLVDYVMELGFC